MSRLNFKFRFQAWEAIVAMLPDVQWEYDESSSKKAGYNVFRDTNEHYNYVCDLGDRYELNLKEGNRTINFWYGADTKSPDEGVPKNDTDSQGDIVVSAQDAFYIKASLAKLASDFITLAISEGDYTRSVDNALNCLSIINKIKEKESNDNDHK